MNIEMAFLCVFGGILFLLIGFPVVLITLKTTEPAMWVISAMIALPIMRWSIHVHKSNLRRN